MKSIREIYKTGKGPSSSHTMGPERAANYFKNAHPQADGFRVILYGSLSKTGVGHGTDRVLREVLAPVPTEIVFSDEALPASAVTETGYYTDEGGWISSPSTLEAGMRHFFEETGVQPYLYILPNGSISSTQQITDMADELYGQLFDDQGHFLFVFCDNNMGQYYYGGHIGAQAESVLDDEALTIFLQYLDRYYYDTSLSEEELFSEAYASTADRIMEVTPSPIVPVAICIAVIVVAICIVAFARHRSKAKAEEQRRQQEILSTPLEKFGDGEVEDLAAKYAAMDGTEEEDSPVDTADLETFGDQDLKELERKYGGKGADGGAARKQD